MKQFFLVHLTDGLCNRMLMVINSLWLGHVYSRNIYFTGFLRDFTKNSTDIIPIEQIIDVDYLNRLLDELGWNTHIETGVIPENIHVVDPVCDIPEKLDSFFYTVEDWQNVLAPYTEASHVLIRRPFCAHQPHNDFWIEHFRFHPKWYEEARNCIRKIFPEEMGYKAFHLRLERYSTERESFCDECISDYRRWVGQYLDKDDFIYVCTGVGKRDGGPSFPNAEAYYQEFRREFPNSRDSDDTEMSDPSFGGKECNAIIDYIIATGASTFYYTRGSLFGYFVATQRQRKCPSVLMQKPSE